MPDIPGNFSTNASIGLNGSFTEQLEIGGDRDWIAIDLVAGESVRVDLSGSGSKPVFDTILTIYDDLGAEVTSNDDIDTAGGNYYSSASFTASETGTYYIEAAGYDLSDTGTYTVTTTEIAPPSLLDSIAWGASIDLATVNVYFAPNGASYDGYTSEGFNAYERGQFIEIMEYLTTILDLDFNIVTNASQAHAILVLDLNEIPTGSGGFLGYFNPPGETNEGIGVFNGNLWDRSSGGDLDRGGFGYVTIVHELLHGLGLAHPHDTGGTSVVMNGVSSAFDDYGDFNLNQGINTIMTYNSGYWTGTDGSAPENATGGDWGFEGGPMALDIAQLQQMYGANTNNMGGNSTYTLATENQAGTYWEALWDTGGRDIIRHDGADSATIDLRAATLEYEAGGGGFVSAVDGVQGGFTIANGVVIENARGGSGDDTLIGNGVANYLVGASGHDRIYGYNGHDRMVGGNGNDRIYGGNGNDSIDGNNGHDRISGGNGADVVSGGGGNDRIYGGDGADRLAGNAGDDRLFGNDGNDRLYGSDGRDRLIGQDGDDRLVGGSGSDRFYGGAGQDVMIGGGGRDGFVFLDTSDTQVGAARDIITDFDSRYDVINLRRIDGNEIIGGNQSFDYVGTAAFSGAAGEVRYYQQGSDLIVAGDTNGDGIADFEILLRNNSSMEADDFLL